MNAPSRALCPQPAARRQLVVPIALLLITQEVVYAPRLSVPAMRSAVLLLAGVAALIRVAAGAITQLFR